ncbi:MAM and LDL-receptor class A domain-containing protein 2-like isoform X3 [Rhipicephalus microplus]|uniref:MAM and LDL-receptor class A domain-containing protein 2-like isoform X3 n=1 Tax=Rhipicephalus microplus TaxID=6941 RepID=UPI003F6ABE60
MIVQASVTSCGFAVRKDGWSAYAVVEKAHIHNAKAQLTRTMQGPFCFTAWYHQSGSLNSQASFRATIVDAGPYWMRARYHNSVFYIPPRDMTAQWQRVRYSERRHEKIEISIQSAVHLFPEQEVFALDDLSVESGECPPETQSGSCDFDWGDACGYSFGNGSDTWRLADKHERGILTDYSTNTFMGGHVYWRPRNKSLVKAGFTSPELPGSNELQCLQFHYYPDVYIGTLNYVIRISTEGARSQVVWMRSMKELGPREWTTAEVAFQEEQNFRIRFECTIEGNHMEVCVIDAIRLQRCKSKRATNKNFCDFENGWCTWKNLDIAHRSSYNAPWVLGGGRTKSTLKRPPQDHTLRNATGSYLFSSSFIQREGMQSELIGDIPTETSMIAQCAHFWYTISEDPETSLEVKYSHVDYECSRKKRAHLQYSQVQALVGMAPFTRTVLWKQNGGKSLSWQQGRIAVPRNRNVVFVGIIGAAKTSGYVALDDISIVHQDQCVPLPEDSEALPASELLSCPLITLDFCHWSAPKALRRIWHYDVVAPPFFSRSEKFEGGNIVSLEGRGLLDASGSVMLTSALVGPQPELSCFSFWYNMFDGQDATMTLTAMKSPASNGMHISQPLLIQQGRTRADIWQNVHRTVNLNGIHNELVFVFSSGPFTDEHFNVVLGPMNFTSGKCVVPTDAHGYCDFEFDTCDWTIESGWQRDQKSTEQLALDATSGPVNSVYVLTATHSTALLTEAVLTSPEWPGLKQPQCLEFWYLSGGMKSARLQVDITVNGESETLWDQPNFVEKGWMLARVETLQEKEFKVVFRAKFRKMGITSISLDDVILRPEPCQHPAHCEFTDGLCGYMNKFEKGIRWRVGKGRYEKFNYPPARPTEKDSPPFAYLSLTMGSWNGSRWAVDSAPAGPETAGLLSPLFDAADEQMVLSVRYHRSGPDIIGANLSISCYGNASTSGNADAQHAFELAESSEWGLLNLTLKHGTRCQLSVWVTAKGNNGSMAIASVQAVRNQTGCSTFFCFNGGTCRWDPFAQSPTCECRHGYRGFRCQIMNNIAAEEIKATYTGALPL